MFQIGFTIYFKCIFTCYKMSTVIFITYWLYTSENADQNINGIKMDFEVMLKYALQV